MREWGADKRNKKTKLAEDNLHIKVLREREVGGGEENWWCLLETQEFLSEWRREALE